MNTLRRFLTFDDVGLIPKFNNITSRLATDISIQLGNTKYNTPIIPANMDTVIGTELAKVCDARGAPIIFHRFVPIQQKIEWIQKFPTAFISVGVNGQEEYKQLAKAGCNKFCIDIAHGHSQQMIDSIKEIYRITDGKADIIAGNVCTPEGFYALAEAGANIIKVGIGPGAACTTRMMTAVGIPQFSAIMNCMPTKEFITARDSRKIYMIADGGIKHPRDACLAIAAGADAVMMGSEFVRTVESAAEKTTRDGHIWARYRGQASTEFMTEYFGNNKVRQPEGVAFDVKITKSANDVFDYYEGGLRSSLTYLGSSNICNYQQTAEFFESTSSYINESNSRPQ